MGTNSIIRNEFNIFINLWKFLSILIMFILFFYILQDFNQIKRIFIRINIVFLLLFIFSFIWFKQKEFIKIIDQNDVKRILNHNSYSSNNIDLTKMDLIVEDYIHIVRLFRSLNKNIKLPDNIKKKSIHDFWSIDINQRLLNIKVIEFENFNIKKLLRISSTLLYDLIASVVLIGVILSVTIASVTDILSLNIFVFVVILIPLSLWLHENSHLLVNYSNDSVCGMMVAIPNFKYLKIPLGVGIITKLDDHKFLRRAIIAFLGPLTNIVIAFLSLFIFFKLEFIIFKWLFIFNTCLAMITLFPFNGKNPSDGFIVFREFFLYFTKRRILHGSYNRKSE